MTIEITTAAVSDPTKPPTLDEQLMLWLKQHNAVIQHFILTPKGERISIENFIQPGWPLVYTVIEKPNDTNGPA